MTILCYHAVDADWESPLAVTPAEFAAHVDWLARNRLVLPLAEAVTRLDNQCRLPSPYVAITFDDGFASVYEHALPVLRQHGLPATVFVVAGTLAPGGREVDWVDTPPSWRLRTLDVGSIRELRDNGVTIGSHSFGHDVLPDLDAEVCEVDLRESRQLLEDLVEGPVPFLAYPRGRHSRVVRTAAERAGYTHAFTLPEAREAIGPFAVPRVGIYPGNGTRSLWLKTRPWYLAARTSPAYPALRRLAGRPPTTARVG